MSVRVGFYHCTRSAPRDVLPALAAKALAKHRVAVHAQGAAEIEALDSYLWTYDPGSFLPHGRESAAGGQPMLLIDHFEPENGADVLICLGGKLPGDPSGFARILYLFDGGREDEVAAARAHWRALAARDDVKPTYWTQGERGGWTEKR